MNKQLAWLSGICGCLAISLLIARSAPGAVSLHEDAQDRNATAAAESTISRTLRFAAGGDRTLVIRLVNGSIQVSGSDGPDVDLQVRKRVRAESEADRSAAEREVTLDIADNAPLIGAVAHQPDTSVCGESGDRNGWWRRPRYQVAFDVAVRVPRGTFLQLCAINDGEIRVDRTAGDFDITHVNGPITMNGVRGSGHARTVNGHLAVSFIDTPPGSSTFQTHNGTVTATFPAGLSADLRLKTFNGGLFTDFDVQSLAQPAPAVERRGMKSVYRSNDFARVRVGGGGPELTFETFNGDVRVIRERR
jgi:hypothetical protein